MSQQGYDSGKGAESFFVIMILGVGALCIFLYNNADAIANVYKWVKVVEMAPFYFFSDQVQNAIHAAIYRDQGWNYIEAVNLHVMPWTSWLPGSIFCYWGIKRIMSSGGINTRYNMEKLLVRVEPLYPHLKDFLTVHPEKLPILYKRSQKNTHKWAMSISPRDFGLMNPPMGLERAAKKNKALKAPIWDGKTGFDFDLAERSFATQMGERFTGINHLKAHERSVFDSFKAQVTMTQESKLDYFMLIAKPILRVKGSKAMPDSKMGEGLKQLKVFIEKDIESKKNPIKSKKKKGNEIKFDPRDYISEQTVADLVGNADNKKIQDIFKLIYAEEVMGSHAFVKTGLMELLEVARNSGVFATDQIKWLKQVDRPLWYCMTSVGRKTSFVEAAGPFSHWLLEKQVGRPVSHPEVSEAVQGLWKALECDKEEE